jgi:alpha-glucosidase
MRPVFFLDPKDKSLRDDGDRFLLGPDLLIVPSWAQNQNPPHAGWKRISLVEGDLSDKHQPKVYLRPGSVLPLAPVAQSTVSQSQDVISIIANFNTDGRATGQVYQDHDDGWEFLRGDYRMTNIIVDKEHGGNTNLKTSFKGDLDLPLSQFVLQEL